MIDKTKSLIKASSW